MTRKTSFPERLSALQRLACAAAAGFCAFGAHHLLSAGGSAFLVAWDVGAAAYLTLTWTMIVRSDPGETRRHARNQDVGAYVIFVAVLVAAFASIAAIAFPLSGSQDLDPWPKAAHIFLSVFALLSSWLLIHTLYTFHYARGYYTSDAEGDAERRGLNFPGRGNPDYFDFAYYSFVVGMTSQVSDVSITAHHMRRLTLMHSVLSFIFNIAVLAMSVNIIVTVIGS